MNFFLPVLLIFLTVSGCRFSSQEVEYEKARRASERGDSARAIRHYKRVASRDSTSQLSLNAARQAAEIASLQTETYLEAISFYRHLVVHSPDVTERKASQEKIASIYFDKINDYQSAIVEMHKVLDGEDDRERRYRYKFLIARSYFYLNNFFQALVEAEELLKFADTPEQKFQALLFKANVSLNDKNIEGALAIFKRLAEEYPEASVNEKVHISIAVCHEELGDYGEAIRVLEEAKAHYGSNQFVELKIARLKQRKENQPSVKRLGR